MRARLGARVNIASKDRPVKSEDQERDDWENYPRASFLLSEEVAPFLVLRQRRLLLFRYCCSHLVGREYQQQLRTKSYQ